LAAGFRRLRDASAPANIHRASGAEEFACKIWKKVFSAETTWRAFLIRMYV
jgi:hypothetical protein